MSQLDKPTRSALAQGRLGALQRQRDTAVNCLNNLRGLYLDIHPGMVSDTIPTMIDRALAQVYRDSL